MEYSAVTVAVGVWFYSLDTQRYLYLMRKDAKNPNTWGLPGGKINSGESLLAAINRECCEELGCMPDYSRLVPIEKFTSTDGKFEFHTFFCAVTKEFTPLLNEEHKGYAWIDGDTWPKPMHPGLWSTVNFQEVMDKISIIQQQL
jgi:8-oxo-dGTP diphosphatase